MDDLDDLFHSVKYHYGSDKPFLTKRAFKVWSKMHQILCFKDARFVKIYEIADETGIDYRTVSSHLTMLVKLGFVSKLLNGEYVPLIV